MLPTNRVIHLLVLPPSGCGYMGGSDTKVTVLVHGELELMCFTLRETVQQTTMGIKLVLVLY